MRTIAHRSIALFSAGYYLVLALLGVYSCLSGTSSVSAALIVPMLFSIGLLSLVLISSYVISLIAGIMYLSDIRRSKHGFNLLLGLGAWAAAYGLLEQLDPIARSSLFGTWGVVLFALSFLQMTLRPVPLRRLWNAADKGEEEAVIDGWLSSLRSGHEVGVWVFLGLSYAVASGPSGPYADVSIGHWLIAVVLTLAAFAYAVLKVLRVTARRYSLLLTTGLILIPSAAFSLAVLPAPVLYQSRITSLILSVAYAATACHLLAVWAWTSTPIWAGEPRTTPDAESGDFGGSGTSPLVAHRSLLQIARRCLIMVILLALVLIIPGSWILVSLSEIRCTIKGGEGCSGEAGLLLSESELRKAEARLEEIYRQGDMEACTEFKGRRYAEGKEAGNGTTELYWTCVHTLSRSLLDEGRCFSLSDDYSKRICLQALAEVYQDPSYCQRADAFAQDEAARWSYPRTASDSCYESLGACEYVEEVQIREECLLQRVTRARDLDPSLCRAFTDPRVKDDCFARVAGFRNLPELCLQTSDADDCYFDAVVWALNLGTEDAIDRESWCERIQDGDLRQICLK